MELLETPVKDGILYQQHVKFGKKSWRKVWGLLYAGGPSGVARLESWEVRDGGQGPAGDRSAGPGRRGERRVIRLADCVSVLPADGESCPRDTGAFLLTTTERSHLLAAQHRQAWIGSICQLAFPGTGESSSGSGEAEAPKRGPVPMEENSIYSSWKEVGEFPVVVQRTEAAARCQLKGPYLLLLGQDAIQLSEPASPQALYTWPYRFLRKFGSDKVSRPPLRLGPGPRRQGPRRAARPTRGPEPAAAAEPRGPAEPVLYASVCKRASVPAGAAEHLYENLRLLEAAGPPASPIYHNSQDLSWPGPACDSSLEAQYRRLLELELADNGDSDEAGGSACPGSHTGFKAKLVTLLSRERRKGPAPCDRP
ncbi:Docking protein 3 [Camelus dromedarius]|uniref:Docking protein 3 n=1 Tax=Camelus dromedarius TaxID=9838 RepID=A0A5N4CMN0_CAMDR|nr:Docking protein 3 [Camelus dromedarius]